MLLLAAGLGLAGCSTGRNQGPDISDDRYVTGDGKTILYPVGKRSTAPAVSGSTVDGGTLSLADQRGKVVVLNFWAEWCPPCNAESPALEQVYRSTKDSGVAFIGVNSRDERDKARAYEQDHLSYPSLFDPTGRVALKFPDVAVTLPTTIVIDRSGRVAAAIHDAVTADGLTKVVSQIAAERG